MAASFGEPGRKPPQLLASRPRGVMTLLLSLSVAATLSFLPTASATDYCATDGSDYSYSETQQGGVYRKISYNGCPNHIHTNAIGDNPNRAVMSSKTFKVPMYPMYDTSEQTDLSEQGGVVGITRNGAQIYSAYAGSQTGAATKYKKSAPYLVRELAEGGGGSGMARY